MTDMQREAFEKWVTGNGEWQPAANMNGRGNYVMLSTSLAWAGWQAAIHHMSEQQEKSQ